MRSDGSHGLGVQEGTDSFSNAGTETQGKRVGHDVAAPFCPAIMRERSVHRPGLKYQPRGGGNLQLPLVAAFARHHGGQGLRVRIGLGGVWPFSRANGTVICYGSVQKNDRSY